MVAERFFLRLLSPYKSILEEEVDAVIVPGELGEFGVLSKHTRFVTSLVPGTLRYVKDGQTFRLAVGGGFAEVHTEGVTVLADSVERPEEIDLERAKQARNQALEKLKNRPSMDESQILRWEQHLQRAQNRLKLTS